MFPSSRVSSGAPFPLHRDPGRAPGAAWVCKGLHLPPYTCEEAPAGNLSPRRQATSSGVSPCSSGGLCQRQGWCQRHDVTTCPVGRASCLDVGQICHCLASPRPPRHWVGGPGPGPKPAGMRLERDHGALLGDQGLGRAKAKEQKSPPGCVGSEASGPSTSSQEQP